MELRPNRYMARFGMVSALWYGTETPHWRPTMYAILIVDNIGNVRHWQTMTHKAAQEAIKCLPANGWAFHSLVELA